MNHKTMLIVDDIEVNRSLLAEYFESEFTVLHAAGGKAALRIIEQHAEEITIILLDIIMPKMDGIEVLKWLKSSQYCNIPVIAVTAEPGYQLKALENGAWDFIAKPIENSIIRARVNNVLGRYALEHERENNRLLTKAKREMDHLINSIPGGIAIYRLTNRFLATYFSDGVAQLSGYTREEYAALTREDAAAVVYEEDKARILEEAAAALRSGSCVDETYRIRHKNGSLLWVHLNGALIGYEGNVPIMHAIFQRPSRMTQPYGNLVNESQSLIYVSDTQNYDLLYMNHTGLETIGKQGIDYSGKKCYEFLFGRTSPCEFCNIDRMHKDSFYVRNFSYPQNGRTYSMRGKLTDWNGIKAHVEYLEDISEQLKVEQRNAELNHQLQSVMENIPGGMCVYRMDRDGFQPIIHNQAFFDIFGYSPEHERTVMKKTSYLNVHPDDLSVLKEKILEGAQNNAKINHTYRIFNDRKGCYIWVNLNGVVVPQRDGTKLCYISYTDVTGERETQEKLTDARLVLEELRQKAEDALNNYKLLVNAVPGGIVQYEVKGDQVLTRYFSDGICELTGYTREERAQWCDQSVLHLTYEEDAPLLQAAIREAVAAHRNLGITYRIRTRSGEPRWVHLSAAYSQGHHGEHLFQAVFSDVDKEKKIEQALQENQLRYEVAIKSSGINIWEYDIQKDSLFVISNSARIKQNCFVVEQYIQSTLNNGYVRADSIDRFLSIFDRLRRGVKEVTEDIWYKTTDEAGWWCERVTYTATFDEAGTPVKAFGAGRDVTREKEAEKRFHEEMSYRKAIQSDKLATIMVDLSNNRVLEINSQFQSVQQLTGGTADHYFAETARRITGEEIQRQFIRLFNRRALLNRFKSGEFSASMELTRLFDTNTIYWINYNVHLIQNPETKSIIAHIAGADITHEKVMQTIMETVAQTDYDFFVVVDGDSDSALDYGRESGTHLFNDLESFEAQNEKLVRASVCPQDVERVVEECKIENAWAHVKDGVPYKFSFGMATPEGELRRKQIQLYAISEVRKTFLMSRIDVSSIYEEQELAKQKLQQALLAAKQANKVKTEFLSRMSHDIRTPMNAVISLTSLGLEAATLAEAQDDLRKIGASGEYLLAIINNVLNLSRMESKQIVFHPVVVYMPAFIQETMAIIMPNATEKHIDITLRQDGIESEYIRLDTTYVRQVVVNLLSNAIKFTPRGGKVELILQNIARQDGYVQNQMIIRDNGIGISAEFLPHIFSPFEQENTQDDLGRQGTGLGLTIVKNIVDLMGGTIAVESEKGKGTAFAVRWSFQTAGKEEFSVRPQFTNPAVPGLLSGRKVLLVEDHPLNTEIARKLLEKMGMHVDHAPNGKLALERFSSSTPGEYDAILMDIRMPVMNGLEAARAIRALERPDSKAIPILAMTANAFDEDVQTAQDAGMNAHLAKPIDPQKLYTTLANYISAYRGK